VKDIRSWWVFFWSFFGTKYPNIAADHIPQLLQEVMDRKQMVLVGLLPVSTITLCIAFHRINKKRTLYSRIDISSLQHFLVIPLNEV
jgi:hypothetical protein